MGADGPNSRVREYLLGPEKARVTPIDLLHFNIVTCYGDAEKAKYLRSNHPIWSMVVYPGMVVLISSKFWRLLLS